jgi:sec-independent protein translocase protein TatA
VGPEWIVVAVVAIAVIFGVDKLPKMARNVGRAQSEFKKGMREGLAGLGEDDAPAQEAPKTAQAAPPPAAAPTPVEIPKLPEG